MQHKTYLSTNTLVTTKAPPGKGGSILQMKPRQRCGRLRIVSALGAHQTTDGADGGGLFTFGHLGEKRGAAAAAPGETKHRSHIAICICFMTLDSLLIE